MSVPFTRSYTRTVYAPTGAFTAGVYAEGSTSTSTISASVQVAPGKELLKLSEADRTRDARVAYTTTELSTGTDLAASTQSPDELTIEGNQYAVHKVEPWQPPGFGIQHYKCLVVRKN